MLRSITRTVALSLLASVAAFAMLAPVAFASESLAPPVEESEQITDPAAEPQSPATLDCTGCGERKVCAESLWVRKAIDGEAIGILYYGNTIDVERFKLTDNGEHRWAYGVAHTDNGNITGWVLADGDYLC